MSVEIHIVQEATNELVESLNHLLAQLSKSATPLSIERVSKIIESSAVTLFAAQIDQDVIGTLTLVVFPIPSGLRAWIEDVVVDVTARGTGAGAALTSAAIEMARQRGARSIDLTSRPSRTAANGLYVKLGFELRKTNVYRLSL